MFQFSFVIFILMFALPAWSQPTAPCPKNILKGYSYTGFNADGDKYQDASKRVTLYVKCFSHRVSPEDLVARWKPEANPKNMIGEAVFFEMNYETKSRRVYVVTRKPVMQMIFETRWRNRIWLEATQDLMEKFAARGKKSPIAKRPAAATKPAAAQRKR